MGNFHPGIHDASARHGSEPRLIAIVDDEVAVRAAVGNLLESSGFKVEVFASAEELLRSNHLNKMACLILDIRLPGLGGLQVQSRLPEQKKAIPIIFITAHADEGVREQALRAGAAAFFYKPFDADALLNAVRSALKRSRE